VRQGAEACGGLRGAALSSLLAPRVPASGDAGAKGVSGVPDRRGLNGLPLVYPEHRHSCSGFRGLFWAGNGGPEGRGRERTWRTCDTRGTILHPGCTPFSLVLSPLVPERAVSPS